MKNAIMNVKMAMVGLACFWSVPISLSAIEIVSPQVGAEICCLKPGQQAFLGNDCQERRAKFVDREWRHHVACDVGGDPLPIRLMWRNANGLCKVCVGYDGKTFLATNLVGNSVEVWNLEIAREYVWTVCDSTSVVTGRFSTADIAPRSIHLPNVANVRDLGGRIGLQGRRVRQGLVYRSGGLNKNAHVYYSAKEVMGFYNAGLLESKFGEQGRKVKEQIIRDKGEFKFDPHAPFLRKSLIKKECKGATNMTDESLVYATTVLGWKTDIDLRRDNEIWGMEGSPAGAQVKWLNYPSAAYGGMGTKKGKDAFVHVFRAFLAEENYPIVFHCIAGADRTGAVAYILNALLGVSDQELDKDWEFTAFTNESSGFVHEARYDKLKAVFAGCKGTNTMQRVESYVKGLGFTDKDISHFRKIMLEDGK